MTEPAAPSRSDEPDTIDQVDRAVDSGETDSGSSGRRPRLFKAVPDYETARRRLKWWREILVIFVLYEVYTLIRNTFGSNGNSIHNTVDPESVATALSHAHDVIGIERHLGFFFEPHLQHWYLGLPHHGFIRVWNIYYGSFHFIVPVIILFWLFRRHPRHYAYWRNALAVVTVLGLVGFASFSLMPPRLLSYAGEYGGCSVPQHLVNLDPRIHCQSFGIVDTLAVYGGLWSFGSSTMAHISNQYAAMPSLHVGWSTWSALVVVPRMKRWWTKILVALYPCATLFCILVTGNHYWLDAAGGLFSLSLAIVIGFSAANLMHRLADRRDRSRVAPQLET